MKIKNETEIQLMKILFKTSGKKPTKNITSQRAYPHGIEAKYFRQLKSFFKPLTTYVNKYINEHLEPLLRGDSTELHLDTIPGQSFRNMIYNLQDWLSVYMPDIADLPSNSNNNIILTALGRTADEAKSFGDKEFQKTIEKGIHVNPPTASEWWNDMKSSWAENNYTLITSNAKKYVEQINVLTEQAIVNGMSPAKLKEEIKKATEGLSDKHCKLLARDQIGKLNGQITESQMQEIGLDLYVWSTSYDDRVRDSHALMEGLLCRWDDASVCSYNNGKTWVPRPAGAVDLHPGQDIQCRCVGLAFYPELTAEVSGTSLENIESPALYVPFEESEEAVPAINPYRLEEQKISIQQNFNNALQTIENEDLRNYVKNALDTSNMSNEDTRIIFYRIMKKMKEPYVTYKDWKDVSSNYKNGVIYIDKQALKNKDKKHIVHELGHAFAHLDDRTSKVYSLQENFQKAVRKDYNSMLAKYNNNKEKLNDYIIQFVKKNPESYGGISDIFGGMQGKHLPGVPGHRTSYWQEDVNNIYEDAYADIFTMMFDTNASKVLKDFFPNSYNKIKKQVFYGVGGML